MNKQNTSQTIICLVRHGETDWNTLGKLQGTEDTELNSTGREQAIEAASYFDKESWDIVVSSPLKRALETAQIIANKISIPDIHMNDELVERSYGDAEGLLPEERLLQFPDGIVPGQEDFEHLRERAMAALNIIATEFMGKKIIVVSHGGIIYTILYTLLGSAFNNLKLHLKNGSINKLRLENNTWSVEFYNKTSNELIPVQKNQNEQ
ncbi:MAG: histidine phosphatase family protein [Paludibacter sp.]|nr:histidine phosphatase family protein [Paludibacter sp.]